MPDESIYSDAKILVVDDAPPMRCILVSILKKAGFVYFYEASGGSEALKIISSHSDISLIISDWRMPLMSGLQFLEKIRSTDSTKSVPFIMVTGVDEKEHIALAIKAGANDYILKPYSAQILQTKVIKVLQGMQRPPAGEDPEEKNTQGK